MKKGLIFLIIGCMIVQLIGCSFGGSNKTEQITRIKIGVSVYDQYDTFIAGMVEAFQKAANEKEAQTGISLQVEIVNASGSQIEQNNQIEDFIVNGYDIVCVNLVDRTDPATIIEKAKNAQIPVVFFNRELVAEDLERWDKLYYVGAVALESGTMEGEIAAREFQSNPEADKNKDGIMQYVMLEGEAGHQDAIIRTENSVNAIIETGLSVEKIAHAIANWNRAQAQTKMQQWLEEYNGNIEVVLANNDDMALGAIDALRAELEREDWPLVVGIDGTKVGLEAVKNRELIGTVYNDGIGQAKEMLELCYALIMQTELPESVELIDGKYIRLPHTIVSKENVEEFLQR